MMMDLLLIFLQGLIAMMVLLILFMFGTIIFDKTKRLIADEDRELKEESMRLLCVIAAAFTIGAMVNYFSDVVQT